MKGKPLKSRTTIFLAALLTASLCFSGSGGGTESKTNASPADSSPASSEGTTPATTGDRKLTIGQQTNSFITDYDDNYLTKRIEEEMDCEIEFYLLPSDGTELRTKISLMVSSKDNMPDIVNVDNALTPEMVLDYGSKGAFIPLNDYIADPEKAPNFTAIADDDKEEILKAITSPDGNIYCMPKYEPETWNLTPYRMYINNTWLETLNLSIPTTTEELLTVLTAFRDNDPNGNGVQDEIGVYGFAEGGYGQNTTWALMNSFVSYNGGGTNGGLALDESGQKVIAPFVTDEWKEGLTYLNQLYSERLLAASMFTDDDTQFKATLNNETNVVGLVSVGSTGNWPDVDNNPNFAEMEIIAPLAGPKGIRYTPYNPYTCSREFFITSNCKNPELAFQLGDLFLGREFTTIGRFGEEGVDWSTDPEILASTSNAYLEAGLYDELYLAYMTNTWSEPSNKFWHNINPRYATLEMGNTVGNAVSGFDASKKSAPLNAFSYEHYYPAHPEHSLPQLQYTAEEALACSEAITNISDYIKQSTAEFVTGARDVDTGWDAYLKELENMGLSPWIEAAQTAYDRSK